MSGDLFHFQQESNISGNTLKGEVGLALGSNANARSVLDAAVHGTPKDEKLTYRTSTDVFKDALLQTLLPDVRKYHDDPILHDPYYNGGIPQLPEKSGVIETRMIEDDLVIVLTRVDASSGKKWYVMDFVRPHATSVLRCYFDLESRKAYRLHLMPIYARQRNILLQSPHQVKSMQMLKGYSKLTEHIHRQETE